MEAISRSCLPAAAARTKRQRKATCCGVLGAASHRTTCSRSSAAKLTSGPILAMRTHISYWPQYVYLFMIHTTRLVCSPASRGSGPHCQSVQNSGSRASGVLVDGPRERRGISLAANRSGLDHGKAGDFLEIAEVQRREFVAEMQRCRADQ